MDAKMQNPSRAEPQPGPASAPALDIHRVLGTLRRWMRLFVAVALVTFVVVAAYTLTRTPRFEATASLLLDERAPDVLNLDSASSSRVASPQASVTSSMVDTQVEVLKSRDLAGHVVDQLHLERDPEFNGALRPPSRFAFLSHLGGGGAPAVDLDPGELRRREHLSVVDALLAGLRVERVGLSYVINVSFESDNPVTAAAVSNAFLQQYLTQAFNAKLGATGSATSWLDSRLAQLKNQVVAADQAVQQYKIAHNLLSAQGATLTEQEISSLDAQVTQARAAEAEQDAKLSTAREQLAAGSNGSDVGEALNSNVVQSLRAQRAQASALLANLQAHYGPKHPQVIKAEQALDDIDKQIQLEIERVISNLKAQATVAHSRTRALSGASNASRGTLASNNRASVQLQALERDDEAARAIYEGFLARYKELQAQQGDEQSDARIISNAHTPSAPVRPNKKLDLLLAAALAMAAASAAVLVAELLTRGVSSPKEIEELFGLPALGEIPTLASTLKHTRSSARLDPIAYVSEAPLSRFTEAFRYLRTSIATSRSGEPAQVVALTSSQPGEGKTTTAICLARTAAMSGARVVLVDCDLRRRSINRALGVQPEAGLIEVLEGQVGLDQALLRDPTSKAMFLPLSSRPASPHDLFGTPMMADLMQTLRERFDLIILDTAPILAVADTAVLCPLADAVVLLTRWRRTSRKAVQAALHEFSSDTFLAGIALTQVDVREQARAGEGSRYNYRAYRDYYAG